MAATGVGFVVIDLGSTNGTMLDGRELQPGEEVLIDKEIMLEVLDTKFVFSPVENDAIAQFTLGESGNMARHLLAEAVARQSAHDDAYVDLDGANVAIGDGLSIGPKGDLVSTADAELVRDGDGFAIIPGVGPTLVNSKELKSQIRLNSQDRVEVGERKFTFVDPLESFFLELEGRSAPKPTTVSPFVEPKSGWSPLERVMFVAALILIVVGILAIVWIASVR